MVLLIDNYDSFSDNLKHLLLRAGAGVVSVKNDDPALPAYAQKAHALVISPGPSHPGNAGLCKQLVREAPAQKCILGVCLGMQIINEVFGGTTGRAPWPVHGQARDVQITGASPLLSGLPSPFRAARYHSLICSVVASEFDICATHANLPMAIQHHRRPLFGVQFHPESFMTDHGLTIIRNFLNLIS